jgi:hypothetical protein
MLMQKDKDILRFLEDNKSATLHQLSDIFFKGLYKSASRRLVKLEKERKGYFKSYYLTDYKKQKAFYLKQQLSSHDLISLDVYAKLFKLGANILEFKAQFQENNGLQYVKGTVKPDAYFKFNYNKSQNKPNDEDEYYEFFLEVDLNHYTENDKMILYEKLNREDFNNEMPTLLILRETTRTMYKSKTLDIFYEDIDISMDSLSRIFPKF